MAGRCRGIQGLREHIGNGRDPVLVHLTFLELLAGCVGGGNPYSVPLRRVATTILDELQAIVIIRHSWPAAIQWPRLRTNSARNDERNVASAQGPEADLR